MDKEKIQYVIDNYRVENWPYSKVFESFMGAGVEAYEVTVDTFEITFSGTQQTWKKSLSLNLLPLNIKNTFSVGKVAEIWDRRQNGKTSYAMFLHAAARAGVKSYSVDMYSKIISFYGVNPMKQHCEYIS